MDADRIERLVSQVLEETRAFRQETLDKFAEVNEQLAVAAQERHALRRDVGLVQTAVLEVAKDLRRVEAKLDATIKDHGARLDKLEGAAE